MARKARIGVIGTGWWATSVHIPSLLQNPDAEIVGICDVNPDRVRAAAEKYGIRHWFTDHKQLLQMELDGVIIATPHNTHYQLAKDALEAGVDVLVEKPMVLKSEHGKELVALAKARGRNLHVGYPWPYTPHARKLQEIVLSGGLGEIQLATSLFASTVYEFYRGRPDKWNDLGWYALHGPTPETYSRPDVAGGGQGQTQVTHSASLLFFLSGLRPVEVFAYMANFGFDVDLVDAISFKAANGAVGSVSSTGNVPAGQRLQGEYRIYGSDGYALLETHAGLLSIHKSDGTTIEEDTLPEAERYPQWMTSQRLVETILGRAPVHVSGELGLLTVQFLEAAYESARTGRPVAIQ